MNQPRISNATLLLHLDDAFIALRKLSNDYENRNGVRPRIVWDGTTLHVDERPTLSFDALDSEIESAVASGEPGPMF